MVGDFKKPKRDCLQNTHEVHPQYEEILLGIGGWTGHSHTGFQQLDWAAEQRNWRKRVFNEDLLFINCYQMQDLQLFTTKRITCSVIARISQNVVIQMLVTRSSSLAAPNWSWELYRKLTSNSWFTSNHSSTRNTWKSWSHTCDCAWETISPDDIKGLNQEVSQWVSNNSRLLHIPISTQSMFFKVPNTAKNC